MKFDGKYYDLHSIVDSLKEAKRIAKASGKKWKVVGKRRSSNSHDFAIYLRNKGKRSKSRMYGFHHSKRKARY